MRLCVRACVWDAHLHRQKECIAFQRPEMQFISQIYSNYCNWAQRSSVIVYQQDFFLLGGNFTQHLRGSDFPFIQTFEALYHISVESGSTLHKQVGKTQLANCPKIIHYKRTEDTSRFFSWAAETKMVFSLKVVFVSLNNFNRFFRPYSKISQHQLYRILVI